MLRLTDKQEAVFKFIEAYVAENGFAPAIAEVAFKFGWKSDNAAYLHILALSRKGFINVSKKTARGITIVRLDQEIESRNLFNKIVQHHEYFIDYIKQQAVTA